MCPKLKHILTGSILGILLLAPTACDKISLPRLGFEDKPEPRLPVAVTFAFAPELVGYTHTVDACGLPHSIPVGKIVSNTFMRVGQERFNGVRAEPPVGQAQGAILDGYRVLVNFRKFGFDNVTGTNEEERYDATIDLNILAIYEDSGGTALAQTPLTYHKNTNIWVPALASQSTSCATGSIDRAVEEAAETLAKEMASVMPRLSQPTQAHSPAVVSAEEQTSVPLRQPTKPAVQYRTKLVDANRNLVLEANEAVVLFIEITNTGDTDIPSAYVELRGTPLLVEAFKRVAQLPVPLGSLKSGEKRTAEIRGRLGAISKGTQGELIIGIILSEGLPPGTHSIRTEIQPNL